MQIWYCKRGNKGEQFLFATSLSIYVLEKDNGIFICFEKCTVSHYRFLKSGLCRTDVTEANWNTRFCTDSRKAFSTIQEIQLTNNFVIIQPHLTVIDRITLALFNDTGWYKVNMSRASQLLWGKGMGCNFGSLASCRSKNSSFFCTTSK